MASKTAYLKQRGLLVKAPGFLDANVQYEVIMGSTAYGVSEDHSDIDLYGFAIPPKDHLFPHLEGHILGFDPDYPAFQQFQQHHIVDKTHKSVEYDLTIYSIIKYFRLLCDGNPNIVDSLFVPRRCIVHSTAIGEMVREQRTMFLHKGCWQKFKGYAYTQMHKMRTKGPTGKRAEIIQEFGYDVKFAYHVVRLLNEVEQIMAEGYLELDRNSDQLKSIRRGEWSLTQVETYFHEKEQSLEQLYLNSKLPVMVDVGKVKQLLLNCLEQHYGSLGHAVVIPGAEKRALQEIQAILNKVNND